MCLKKLKLPGQATFLSLAKKYECKHIMNGGESGFFCAFSSKTVFKGVKNACEPSNMCSFLKE
jgi:hypothetical protein